jgi:hypothetical protein
MCQLMPNELSCHLILTRLKECSAVCNQFRGAMGEIASYYERG